ncbi:MAG: response regulator transcription factor [Candidatus Kapabacteria bacterium]|jgi:DNA-binding NarL/FixJ family response regulator|nr:response regulator transcription factor [Candidatus Kapabacteria bacterium]
MNTLPMRVYLVDDHASFLQGLALALREFSDITVVGMSTDPVSALEQLTQPDMTVDIIFADYSMPGMTGIQFGRDLKRNLPAVKVMIVSMVSTLSIASRSFRLGADGFVAKIANVEEIVSTARSVLAGTFSLEEDVKDDPSVRLTPTELRVLRHIVADELSSREIASTMHVSMHTIDTHRKSMMTKIGTRSVVGLVKYAARIGMITLPRSEVQT